MTRNHLWLWGSVFKTKTLTCLLVCPGSPLEGGDQDHEADGGAILHPDVRLCQLLRADLRPPPLTCWDWCAPQEGTPRLVGLLDHSESSVIQLCWVCSMFTNDWVSLSLTPCPVTSNTAIMVLTLLIMGLTVSIDQKKDYPAQQTLCMIDWSTTLSIDLNNNRFNHKHCYLLYCLQLPCGENLTVIYC